MNALGLTGLVAAPHTPFTAEGEVNLHVVEQQVAVLLESKVSAAFVCGTTGEGLSLTGAERMRLVERWVAAAPASLPVLVHVGHTSVAEARSLAAHAQDAGARAVSAFAPCFFKPRGVPELVDFCARVASGAPGLPFYYYHLPSMTGVLLPMVEFMRQARDRIPTFAGIKYTHDDLVEYQQCLRLADGSLDILFGRDEILLAGLAAGAKGAVGSTYNYAAPVYRRMIAAFRAGDLDAARKLQEQSVRLVDVLRRYGEIPAAKAIMTMLGVPCGPARSPLTNLDDARVESLYGELKSMDIFPHALREPSPGNFSPGRAEGKVAGDAR